MKEPILYYLCLQATRQGQASYSHVREILSGLQRMGVNARLFEPSHVKSAKRPDIFSRLLGFFSTQCRLIFSKKPDVIYVRWHFATIFVALWAKVNKIPVIQEVNGPYDDLFLSYPWTRRFYRFFVYLMRQQLLCADAVITVTPNLRDWVISEVSHTNVHVVTNGANTFIFHTKSSFFDEIILPDRYVVFFGSLSIWQGIDVMINALHSDMWPCDVALVVVGGGVERKKIKDAVKSFKSLLHYDPVQQCILADVIRNSLCSLSPQIGQRSLTGLYPLKLFESLACGVPVIVSDWPGMADLVREHQCGIVIPPGDSNALAYAVAELAADPVSARAMGLRGAAEVRKNHSWEAKAEDTYKIISGVLSTKLLPPPVGKA